MPEPHERGRLPADHAHQRLVVVWVKGGVVGVVREPQHGEQVVPALGGQAAPELAEEPGEWPLVTGRVLAPEPEERHEGEPAFPRFCRHVVHICNPFQWRFRPGYACYQEQTLETISA